MVEIVLISFERKMFGCILLYIFVQVNCGFAKKKCKRMICSISLAETACQKRECFVFGSSSMVIHYRYDHCVTIILSKFVIMCAENLRHMP